MAAKRSTLLQLPQDDPPQGATSEDQQSNSAASLSRLSPKDERHLIAENKSLKAEVKYLKSQLKSHGIYPWPTSSPLQRSASLTSKSSISIDTRSGPGFSSMPKSRPHGKLNRHPSDITDLISNPQNEEDIDKHRSSRGLKHRRHNAQRLNESQEFYDAENASLLKDAGSPLCLRLDDSSESIESRIHNRSSVSTETKTSHQQTRSNFSVAVSDRAGWLVGLLILQSMSSFIISRNEKLLQQHLVIVRFLTMLVGAGGNAGNQASVGVIRGLATGAVNDHNLKDTLLRELQMGLALSLLLGAAGAARAAIFMTPFTETLAVTTSLIAIVFISVLLGAILPILMKFCKIDPVHSSTSIQVIMDILGVSITVYVSGIILGSTA